MKKYLIPLSKDISIAVKSILDITTSGYTENTKDHLSTLLVVGMLFADDETFSIFRDYVENEIETTEDATLMSHLNVITNQLRGGEYRLSAELENNLLNLHDDLGLFDMGRLIGNRATFSEDNVYLILNVNWIAGNSWPIEAST